MQRQSQEDAVKSPTATAPPKPDVSVNGTTPAHRRALARELHKQGLTHAVIADRA